MGADEHHHLASCGRRSNPRLRLRLPALLITLHGQGPAVLENVSISGARISSRFVLRPGESCILRLPSIELFADVAWCAHWRCGLNFERPLAQAQLLAMRELDDVSRPSERDASKDWARAFVNGTAEKRC